MLAVFSYDKARGATAIGDFWAIGQNWKINKNRNKASTASCDVSLRKIAAWCAQYNFDVTRFFTPLRASVQIFDKNNVAIFEGFLTATPALALEGIDASVNLVFGDAIWVLTNDIVVPPKIYNTALSNAINTEINSAISRASSAGAPWGISVGGHQDALATMEDSVTDVKNLADFVLQRTNNVDGAGQFDVYATGNSVLEIWKNLGTDITSSREISFPDFGQPGGAQKLDFPEWSNYFSDVFVTGAGNGYGASGGAITSSRRSAGALANTGYSRFSRQDSSISVQTTLDAHASAYLAYTAKAFSTPTATVNADLLNFCDHRDGGDFWVGDTVAITVDDNFAQYFPVTSGYTFRVDAIALEYDQQARSTATINFVDPNPADSDAQ